MTVTGAPGPAATSGSPAWASNPPLLPPADSSLDPRTPQPNPRIALIGPLAGAFLAAGLYLLILHTNHLPAEWVSVLMYVAAPVLLAVAVPVVWGRRHESLDPDLSWYAAGLAGGLVAMVLQLISFPTITADGGPFGTSASSRPALYLLFHLTPALGVLLGLVRAPHAWRGWFVAATSGFALALAWNLVPLPVLMVGTDFTPALIWGEVVVAGIVLTTATVWLWRAGTWAVPLVAWVGVAQTLSFFDLLFSMLGGARFSPLWWGSLSMRVATYAVLVAGALFALFAYGRRMEQYLGGELDRRESQLRASLHNVSRLLAETTQVSDTLQEQLLPRTVIAPDTMQIAARYAGAGVNKRVGGDWYDVISLPDGGLALVIGDVEGHDLQAAAVMGQVRAAVNSYALEGQPPSILLQQVNRFLLRSEIDRFVALAYVHVYPDDRLLTVAVAGNPSPVLVPHADPAPRALSLENGPPLGLDATYEWPERTMLLPPDTDLAMFTDGVFGRSVWAGEAGETFPCPLGGLGADGWSTDELAEAIISPGTPDDAAVLVARITANAHPVASRTLPASPISAPIVRHWLGDLGDVWAELGLLPDSTHCAENLATCALLLTELVSNAIRNAEYTVRVDLGLDQGVLRMEVFDSSHRMPFVHRGDALDTSGRGLRLIEALATTWGIEQGEAGKSVWCTVDLAGIPYGTGPAVAGSSGADHS